jgi:hypothetical protein
MGSGNKFQVWKADGFGLGFSISRFPFALTISVSLLFWGVSLGFGKGYDE